MNLTNFPYTSTDWSEIDITEHAGETGMAFWRTIFCGDIRIRMVEYSPGYCADHWCSKGHIILCMEGEIVNELKDGRKFTLRPGFSYQVADNDIPHRSYTDKGAKLFIVD